MANAFPNDSTANGRDALNEYAVQAIGRGDSEPGGQRPGRAARNTGTNAARFLAMLRRPPRPVLPSELPRRTLPFMISDDVLDEPATPINGDTNFEATGSRLGIDPPLAPNAQVRPYVELNQSGQSDPSASLNLSIPPGMTNNTIRNGSAYNMDWPTWRGLNRSPPNMSYDEREAFFEELLRVFVRDNQLDMPGANRNGLGPHYLSHLIFVQERRADRESRMQMEKMQTMQDIRATSTAKLAPPLSETELIQSLVGIHKFILF